MITPKFVLKNRRRYRIRKSIRKKVNGTPEIPRLIIVKTNKYLYTQAIDDQNGKVLASATTLEKDIKSKLKSTKNSEAAQMMGKVIAERLKKKKITEIIFDRNVYLFSGNVKMFADSAREKGIKF